LSANDQMQTVAMAQSRPGPLTKTRSHRFLHRMFRQALSDSKKRDVLLIRNMCVPNFLGDAHVKVNILRGQPVIPGLEQRFFGWPMRRLNSLSARLWNAD